MSELADLSESLLWFLESNPSPLSKVQEYFPLSLVRAANEAKLIWFQPSDLTFYLTHSGIRELRARGRKRKPLPHLKWKQNDWEMTADRAIELFAPSSPLSDSGAEKLLTGGAKATRYKDLSPMKVKREGTLLPKKIKVSKI